MAQLAGYLPDFFDCIVDLDIVLIKQAAAARQASYRSANGAALVTSIPSRYSRDALLG